MKKMNFKILIVALTLGFFTACQDDDNDTRGMGYEKSIVSIDQTDVSLTEGDVAVTVTMTIDEPLNTDSDFKLEIVGGSGSFRDYVVSQGMAETETGVDDGYGVIGYHVVFPAYATTATFDLSAPLDMLAEDTENLELRFYSMGNAKSLVAEGSEYINVTISENATVADDLGVELVWGQYYDDFGTLAYDEYIGTDEDPHESQVGITIFI